MNNLKDETLNILYKHGKSIEDIKWIGDSENEIPIDTFFEKADAFYDDGYGGVEVNTWLVVVGEDWWLERHDYDGSEWWEFKTKPVRPQKISMNVKLFPEEEWWY